MIVIERLSLLSLHAMRMQMQLPIFTHTARVLSFSSHRAPGIIWVQVLLHAGQINAQLTVNNYAPHASRRGKSGRGAITAMQGLQLDWTGCCIGMSTPARYPLPATRYLLLPPRGSLEPIELVKGAF